MWNHNSNLLNYYFNLLLTGKERKAAVNSPPFLSLSVSLTLYLTLFLSFFLSDAHTQYARVRCGKEEEIRREMGAHKFHFSLVIYLFYLILYFMFFSSFFLLSSCLSIFHILSWFFGWSCHYYFFVCFFFLFCLLLSIKHFVLYCIVFIVLILSFLIF